jgi:hypothetical protein
VPNRRSQTRLAERLQLAVAKAANPDPDFARHTGEIDLVAQRCVRARVPPNGRERIARERPPNLSAGKRSELTFKLLSTALARKHFRLRKRSRNASSARDGAQNRGRQG